MINEESTATATALQNPAIDPSRPLVSHTRREQWGRALILWEREGKRGYQFEDGEVRVFARPYYKLLQPAKNPDPVLRYQLRERAVASGAIDPIATRGSKAGRKAAAPTPTLEDQVTVFEALFPKGFHGNEWTETYRYRLEGRRLKRHLDPAVEEASKALGAAALDECIESGEYQEIIRRFVDVVGKTTLVTSKQLEGFKSLSVDAELARAMVGFLHDIRKGDLATMARLRRSLARQGFRKLPWAALTAPRALLYPSDHMCVHPSVIRAQAKLLAPRYKISAVPSAADYSRCLELAMAVREHLVKAGFAPRDLLDVAQFMRVTLSRAASEKLLEAMVERRANQTQDENLAAAAEVLESSATTSEA